MPLIVIFSIAMLRKEYQESLADGMNMAAARSAEYLSTSNWQERSDTGSLSIKLAPIDMCLIFLIVYDRRRRFAARPYPVARAAYLIKGAAKALTPLEKAMAESLFMNPLLCLDCLVGDGAMLSRRATSLKIVILAPLVIIICLFHLVMTKSYLWGSLS